MNITNHGKDVIYASLLPEIENAIKVEVGDFITFVLSNGSSLIVEFNTYCGTQITCFDSKINKLFSFSEDRVMLWFSTRRKFFNLVSKKATEIREKQFYERLTKLKGDPKLQAVKEFDKDLTELLK